MVNEAQLSSLLSLWQQQHEHGHDVSAAELCRDCPELLPEVERRLQALQALERLASPGQSTVSSDPHDSLPLAEDGKADGITLEVPGFEILGVLGRGGMGVVYKARDQTLKRVVALKMILVGSHASAEQIARFRAEAEAVARLQHPHIVQIYSSGAHAGQPYFALEFVSEGSLSKQLHGQPQPPREAARLVLLLARAVHAAHQQGIVHRDLKPSNVLLAPPADEPALYTAYGCPKIADFGLAKLQQTGDGLTGSHCILGTPSYMAPEQATGKTREVGPPADIYALGAILYELLTGRPPFQGDSMLDTLEQVRSRPPTPVRQLRPEVPADLEALCLRCLAKRPQERYPTAAALADDLRRFLDGEVIPQPSPSRTTALLRRFHWAVALGVLLLAAGFGLFVAGHIPRGATEGGVPSATDPKPLIPTLAPAAFKGWIDIRVSEPKNPRRQLLRLHEPAARPLKVGDEIRIEVELNRPGYVYVLWIDTQGNVLPVYPWLEGNWQRWREPDQPQQTLGLPEKVGDIYPMEPGLAGMETLVLLLRETPWPRDQDLQALVGKLEPVPLVDPQAMAWFENGTLVQDEANRAPNLKGQGSSNLVLRTQEKLHEKLHEYFSYSRAVCFANQGGR